MAVHGAKFNSLFSFLRNAGWKIVWVGCLLSYNINVKAQNWQWAKSTGGEANDYGQSIATDKNNNVYVTGKFTQGTMFGDTFSIGAITLSNAGGNDIYIAKYNSSGNVIWAKRAGGTGNDISNSISIDSSGNCYVTGYFLSPVLIFGNDTLVNAGSEDIFIVKYDSSGNFIWAKHAGGSSVDIAKSISVDATGNSYITGSFRSSTINFGTNTLTTAGNDDVFIVKYDASGNVVWAKKAGGTYMDNGIGISVDTNSNCYVTGNFRSPSINFGGTTITNSSTNWSEIFVAKFDSAGNHIWSKKAGGAYSEFSKGISVDINENIYLIGEFNYSFNWGGIVISAVGGFQDIFLVKLNATGNIIWGKTAGGSKSNSVNSVSSSTDGNVFITGEFKSPIFSFDNTTITNINNSGNYSDFYFFQLDSSGNIMLAEGLGANGNDGGVGISVDINGYAYVTGYFVSGPITFGSTTLIDTIYLVNAGSFVAKLRTSRIRGFVFNDINENCISEANELGLSGRKLIVNPGNIVTEALNNGNWDINFLPVGTYTITADTSGHWQPTCPITQSFTVANTDSITYAPSFGFISTQPCASPDVSIQMPLMRPCFSNQKIYVQACNQTIATGALDSAFVDVELDDLLAVQSASLTYTAIGNNVYRFNVGTLNPGMCVNFFLTCSLSCNAVFGQSLCMQANLYPADSCVFDTIPSDTSACNTPWDKSSLSVMGSCVNDSIVFVIHNTGDPVDGDMTCYSPVRIYIDGDLMFLDSVQLAGGDSAVFAFSGDGRTWRLEADQHPLHPGNSHPNATVELCGDSVNWTPGLVNLLPMDDAEPVTDIYCGIVTGSYDPNDKTGFPLGVTDSNFISPNQQLQYLIRFQNTGTDTAFTVVIRDTLDLDLNIFSVIPGVASHNYTFKMYGQRVLEWTFNNILLPDSNVNEAASHGFVTFKVQQNPDLPNGTVINNSADIYFDFNAPVITNQTVHIINDGLKTLAPFVTSALSDTACGSYSLNNFTYSYSGIYYQKLQSPGGADSIITLNLVVNQPTSSALSETACDSYTLNSQTYTSSSTYTQTLTNADGCDSTITLNLTILQPTNSTLTETACDSYTLNSQTYTSNGTYTQTLTNAAGCDSAITLNLTILQPTNSTLTETACNSYTLNSQTYTSSGTYTQALTNAGGCDSTITLNLTINQSAISNVQLAICSGDSILVGGNYQTIAGTYYDSLQAINGCDSIIAISLEVNENPDISLTSTPDSGNGNGTATVVASGGTAPYGYLWSTLSGFETLTGLGSGIYSVTVTDANGCETVDSVIVDFYSGKLEAGSRKSEVIIIPNPNGGKFVVQITDKHRFTEYEMKIYNMLGEIIYEKRIGTNIRNMEVDLSKNSSGIYFLQVSDDNVRQTVKIIVE